MSEQPSALRRAASGTLAGLVALGAQLAVQLVTVPVLLRHWTTDTYGLWLATTSLYGLLVTLDMGHQGYVGAQLLQRVGTDLERARESVQAGVAGAVGLAVTEALLVAILAIAGVLDELVGAPSSRSSEVTWTLALFVIPWVATGSAGGVLVRLYTPLGQFARATWLGVFQRTSVMLAPPAVAALGGGPLHAAAAMGAVSSAWAVVIFIDLGRFQEYRPFFTLAVQPRSVFENLRGSVVLTAAAVVIQLQQHGLLLILGASAVGQTAVALFGTTRTMANVLMQGANTFVAPLAPDLVRAHVNKAQSRVVALLLTLGGIGLVASSVGLALLMPVAQPLYAAWTGRALQLDAGAFALLGATVVARTAASPMLTLLQGTNALGPQLTLAMLQTSATLVLALGLSPADGIRGTCAARLFGELLASWAPAPPLVPPAGRRARRRSRDRRRQGRGACIGHSHRSHRRGIRGVPPGRHLCRRARGLRARRRRRLLDHPGRRPRGAQGETPQEGRVISPVRTSCLRGDTQDDVDTSGMTVSERAHRFIRIAALGVKRLGALAHRTSGHRAPRRLGTCQP